MTPENFCYWLRGLLELGKPTELNAEQIDVINKHLDLVLKPVTRTQGVNLNYEFVKFTEPPASC